MTVSVGFDHAGDSDLGADYIAHGAVIPGNLIAGNEDVGAIGRH
jgi:hypothetical protein